MCIGAGEHLDRERAAGLGMDAAHPVGLIKPGHENLAHKAQVCAMAQHGVFVDGQLTGGRRSPCGWLKHHEGDRCAVLVGKLGPRLTLLMECLALIPRLDDDLEVFDVVPGFVDRHLMCEAKRPGVCTRDFAHEVEVDPAREVCSRWGGDRGLRPRRVEGFEVGHDERRDGPVVDQRLEVKMGAGGEAGVAAGSHELAGLDLITRAHPAGGEVQVAALDGAPSMRTVIEMDVVAGLTTVDGLAHGAIGDGVDGLSASAADVLAVVSADVARDRVGADADARACDAVGVDGQHGIEAILLDGEL